MKLRTNPGVVLLSNERWANASWGRRLCHPIQMFYFFHEKLGEREKRLEFKPSE
jgi:hypothetical protein